MIKGERGQSMVEMALIVPLFLFILVGIIDFGKVIYSYAHLQMAAQETVRLGGLGEKDAVITAFAKDYVNLGDTTNLQVEITPNDTIRKSGDYVTVTLRFPHKFMTPIISKFFPASYAIETDSTIRVE
jgi:Flp pilus assembly protein TadG